MKESCRLSLEMITDRISDVDHTLNEDKHLKPFT